MSDSHPLFLILRRAIDMLRSTISFCDHNVVQCNQHDCYDGDMRILDG